MMVHDVKHRSHRHERIDEGQRDPDNKRKILLPERLAGLLPMPATAKQRAQTKVEDTNYKGDERNSDQGKR